MKMQSFRRHRGSLLSAWAPAGGAMLFVALLALSIRFLAPDAFTTLLRPLWGAGDALTVGVGGFMQEDAKTLALRLSVLESENRTLQNENAALRARLATHDSVSGEEGISAGVIARPPLTPYDVLVVSVGKNDKLSIGQIVFAEGVPIGTLAEVNGSSGRVLLFSNAGRETEGWVGEARLPLTVRGAGSGAFFADVAREAEVKEGDMVYVPGPGALPIGSVARIESHASSPRATVFIRPLINPFTLTWVRITGALLP